jgi:hypothetical protein
LLLCSFLLSTRGANPEGLDEVKYYENDKHQAFYRKLKLLSDTNDIQYRLQFDYGGKFWFKLSAKLCFHLFKMTQMHSESLKIFFINCHLESALAPFGFCW